MQLFADIIIEISHEKLDRTFQYMIPEKFADSIFPGAYVMIPFGKGDRQIKGYVVNVTDRPDFDVSKQKEIAGVLNDAPDRPVEVLLKLAAWMKRHYGGTAIASLKCVLPVKARMNVKEKKTVSLLLDRQKAEEVCEDFVQKHQSARARLLKALIETGSADCSLITSKLNISSSVVKVLAERKIISVESAEVYRNPVISGRETKRISELTDGQKKIIGDFFERYDSGDRKPCLIHGVTGSGKTEVYIDIIEGIVKRGKQAIMLIPEISLTFQTVMRFYARFGDRVSYMHSRLSAGERYDQFLRAERGDIDVMIGPRSALFTPFPNLGIIVMDEEHETSYKSETMPKYHARETAQELAELCSAAFVMGSATPSVDAYYRASTGVYRLYTLEERAAGGKLPDVYTVDLREELKNGNRSVFSDKLRSLMNDRLQKREQIMLFLNRRGYAGFVSCRKCGFVYKCPHCDVALSQHGMERLVCHYCGYEIPMAHICPECGSRYIGGMKAGTEQIEKIVNREFPDARTLRMDMDTTRGKGDYEKILGAFADEEADILIGTQMIVKGHDFPNVTLVGILAADMSLYADDYRAGERTFELITQAAGRAGRAEKKGEVVIQTYSPDHYAIAAAAAQDYNMFYAEEEAFRELGEYPPVSHLLSVLIEDRDEAEAGRTASAICGIAGSFGMARTIGPTDAAIGKIKDIYRKQVYVRCMDYEVLSDIKDSIESKRDSDGNFHSHVEFDFDPI